LSNFSSIAWNVAPQNNRVQFVGHRLDVCRVLRQIRNSFAFSAIVVVLLATGLSVATAIFSTVRTVLLSPLPYKDSEQLVQIISTWPRTGDKNDWSTPYRDALASNRSDAVLDAARRRFGN